MDVVDLLLIALFLGASIGLLINGARQLRRGDEVTAEEAVKWRRRARKQGFDASPDMNPHITDILVRAWRSSNGWLNVGLGIGVLLAGIDFGAYLVLSGGDLSGGNPDVYGQTFLLVFVGGFLAIYGSALVGLVLGLAHTKREPHVETTAAAPRRIRDYCPLYVHLYPPALVLAFLVFMFVLVARLAPGLNRVSLTRAFALPGMWSVPVGSAILVALVIATGLVARWIVALPPISLPQDQEVRQRADDHLRRWAIWRLYVFCWMGLSETVLGLYFALGTGTYPRVPLLMAGLDFGFAIYISLVFIMGSISTIMLAPNTATSAIPPAIERNIGHLRDTE